MKQWRASRLGMRAALRNPKILTFKQKRAMQNLISSYQRSLFVRERDSNHFEQYQTNRLVTQTDLHAGEVFSPPPLCQSEDESTDFYDYARRSFTLERSTSTPETSVRLLELGASRPATTSLSARTPNSRWRYFTEVTIELGIVL